jgi:hypothetical protein
LSCLFVLSLDFLLFCFSKKKTKENWHPIVNVCLDGRNNWMTRDQTQKKKKEKKHAHARHHTHWEIAITPTRCQVLKEKERERERIDPHKS